MDQMVLHKNAREAYDLNAQKLILNLKNIIVNLNKELCVYKKFYGNIPEHKKNLRNFREVAV